MKDRTRQTCALCDGPFAHREVVLLEGDTLTHMHCVQTLASGAADLVSTLLIHAPGQRVCHSCLSQMTTVTYEEVRKATTALRVVNGFVIELGATCDTCLNPRVTISYRPLGLRAAQAG